MPVEVPSLNDLLALQARVEALEANEMPDDVKAALLVVLKWLVQKLQPEPVPT